MARLGLGPGWTCVFANDFDALKARAYAENWGPAHLKTADVASLTAADLPGRADLAWASFPCQDLSLAGYGGGLDGGRSGTYWHFQRLLTDLEAEGRAPRLIALENVYGAITSHGGDDLRSILGSLIDLGYTAGPLVLDARNFVPQSRPRLFVVALKNSAPLAIGLTQPLPDPRLHPRSLVSAVAGLRPEHRASLVWWNLPAPPKRTATLADVIEPEPQGVKWHSAQETGRLLDLMSSVNRDKVRRAQELGGPQVGAVYRRTRAGVQRAEARFDGLSGCLRTPGGGSSRQTILIVDGRQVRSRLISAREAARLMGLPDAYKLPARYNDAYHLLGDGLAVPVVEHLRRCLFEPLLAAGDGMHELSAVSGAAFEAAPGGRDSGPEGRMPGGAGRRAPAP